MGKNAYFQVVHKTNKTMLKVFPASKDGEMFSVDEVVRYLDLINFKDVDTVALHNYLNKGDFKLEFLLAKKEILPEDGKTITKIENQGQRAVTRFYPPSDGGRKMTRNDILSDLAQAGIVHGIQQDVIDEFLKNPEFCRDYVVAVATPPVQGHDAVVEYHFDINTTAKPKLNEDGSVDFHQLGNIKPVEVGDKLATLTPADRGKPGINVLGGALPPVKVAVKHLRFGRNITLSEDKCEIYSDVAGHVTLVDDMVMVSDVYEVPANVDSSTGDIEYNGTVNVVGNVNTGYEIRAEGDIIVNGAVEGATLIAGGNIVLKRGMQGMNRGTLEAEGNITAKFIENSTVKCNGTLMCDAVLHSDVECNGKISILGRKGLINGGHIRSYTDIAATQLGSSMGITTSVEIMSDVDLIKRQNDIGEKVEETNAALQKMNVVLIAIKRSINEGNEITPEQERYLKMAAKTKPILKKQIRDMEHEYDNLQKVIDSTQHASIKVESVVNAGVRIIIQDVTRIINDNVSRCKFVREGADVKILGL